MATGYQYVSYTTNNDTVGRIRMSSQVRGYAKQGALDTAITDPNVFAYASNPGSKRKKQLNARGIVIGRTVGVAPNEFTRRTFIPITTSTAFDLILVGEAVTAYAGQSWKVLSKVEEA
jgi:hypothetical protein